MDSGSCKRCSLPVRRQHSRLLCCIFESYARAELPLAVCAAPRKGQNLLYAMREIETDRRARRVEKGVDWPSGAGSRPVDDGLFERRRRQGFDPARLQRAAFQAGPARRRCRAIPMLWRPLPWSGPSTTRPAGCGSFFSLEQRGPMLGAVIHPRHYVLLLRAHFCSRLPDENFVDALDASTAALLR